MSMASLLQDAFTPIYNNRDTMSIWATGLESPSSLSAEDLRIFLLLMDRLMNCFETTIIHHRKGAIEKSEFDRYAQYMVALTRLPGGKTWLDAASFPLSEEAKRLVRDA